MPLSGVFFVSLHHQSNRMTMFKKTDPNPQLDIFTAPSMQLGSRASKKYSDPNAWHNQFYSLVTTKIDEEIFKPLFPEGKKSGRPNASIRILVAMSVLKEGFGCSDEDLFEKCEFDLLTRKALGMELLTDVTPSIDTYYLFRRRICEYQERTGIDMYADGAYQSPDNRKFAKNHNAMQLKTGKMQSRLSYFHSNLIILANCKK